MRLPFFLAKRFVAGETVADAIRVAREYQKKHIAVTLDHLGEDVTDIKKAAAATKIYLTLLRTIKRKNLSANISIKLSQVGLAIDKSLALINTKKILLQAKRLHLTVEIDMEGLSYTQDTLDVYLALIKSVMREIQPALLATVL